MDVRFAKQFQFVEKLKLATPTNQKLVDVLSDLLAYLQTYSSIAAQCVRF